MAQSKKGISLVCLFLSADSTVNLFLRFSRMQTESHKCPLHFFPFHFRHK